MSEFGSSLVAVIMAIIGVAIVAVLVSQKAQTANVLNAGGTAISNVLGAALSPVTGSSALGTATNVASTILNSATS